MDVDLIKTIVIALLGVYEAMARLIPSVKDWTILGNLIKFLRWLSDYLNRKKQEGI